MAKIKKVKTKTIDPKNSSKGEIKFRRYIKRILKEYGVRKDYSVRSHIFFKYCKRIYKNVDIVIYKKDNKDLKTLIEYDGWPHLRELKTVNKDSRVNLCAAKTKRYRLIRILGHIFFQNKNNERFKKLLFKMITDDSWRGLAKIYDNKSLNMLYKKFNV